MARGHDAGERAATGETDESAARPQAQLRWVELRHPREAVEIGRNGRILDSHFHEGYDSWQVLLETYEGELSGSGSSESESE